MKKVKKDFKQTCNTERRNLDPSRPLVLLQSLINLKVTMDKFNEQAV